MGKIMRTSTLAPSAGPDKSRCTTARRQAQAESEQSGARFAPYGRPKKTAARSSSPPAASRSSPSPLERTATPSAVVESQARKASPVSELGSHFSMEWNSDPEGPPSWLNKPEPKRPGVKPWYPPAPKEKKATRASKVAVSTGEQACSRCEKAKPMSAYDKDKKGEYLKTCRACKEYQKAYAASKKAKVSKK